MDADRFHGFAKTCQISPQIPISKYLYSLKITSERSTIMIDKSYDVEGTIVRWRARNIMGFKNADLELSKHDIFEEGFF